MPGFSVFIFHIWYEGIVKENCNQKMMRNIMTEAFSGFELKPPVNYVSDYERVTIALRTDYLKSI